MASTSSSEPLLWSPQPDTARQLSQWVAALRDRSPFLKQLAERLLAETGTRLIDWIDHLAFPLSPERQAALTEAGFQPAELGRYVQPRGLFPPVYLIGNAATERLAIKVDSVTDFLLAHGLTDRAEVQGVPLGPLRTARAAAENGVETWVVERAGEAGLSISDPRALLPETLQAAACTLDSFRRRRRGFTHPAEGFEHAAELIRGAVKYLGTDRACALFFAAERDYWQSRNRAARMQKFRQDGLGLGWANHDHHTYRSSREHFHRLIEVLELLGLECRERFYSGHEAGWGAQVLEQPRCGIVVFADVDLSPAEVMGDFSHAGLSAREELGTVGLWCALHGEAFLEAGMHHLECQFDYSAAREQLASSGVACMPPFTDFPYLQQAFTQGEVWPVAPERVAALRAAGRISAEQAERFLAHGVLGSHLEILERNDGYKGFNQTGISDIIARTDPRNL